MPIVFAFVFTVSAFFLESDLRGREAFFAVDEVLVRLAGAFLTPDVDLESAADFALFRARAAVGFA